MLGSFLTREIFVADPRARIAGWGGQQLKQTGVEMYRSLDDLQQMGITELLKDPLASFRIISSCKKDILRFNPHLIILVDYGGLNLQIAKWAKKKGYRTLYFIPPKIWASRGWRIHTLQSAVDHLAVIFPFEKDFYASKGLNATLVKNPWLEKIDEYKSRKVKNSIVPSKGMDVAAVLPGSRKKEIKNSIPRILPVIRNFQDMTWYISVAPGMDKSDIMYHIPEEDQEKVVLFDGDVYELLLQSDLAIVTSGTATLETALFEVPQVVCYHTSLLNYFLAKRLITVPFISLVNLILGEQAVVELIQNDMNTSRITEEINKLRNPQQRGLLINKYRVLKKRLIQGIDMSTLAKSCYKAATSER